MNRLSVSLPLSALILFLATCAASAQSGPLSNGYIYTYAGNGTIFYGGDGGPATSASLWGPVGVVVDAAGNVYIADAGNNRIRKVDAVTGIITTVVGNGTAGYSGDGGPATSAEIQGPNGLALDNSGDLYIADLGNVRIRRVDASTGMITTVAGNGIIADSGDGGPATSAEFLEPRGIALDSAGNLYIADSNIAKIRKVDAATGIITTVAGRGGWGYSGDGGPATSALLNEPLGLTVDAYGNIYIGDSNNNRVRKVDAVTGIITTFAGGGSPVVGNGDGGPATSAQLLFPEGVLVDAAGNLYVAETAPGSIRRIDVVTGIITTVAGNGTPGFTGDGGPAIDAELAWPVEIALSLAGNLYISDYDDDHVRVVRPDALGTITTTTTLTAVPTTLTSGQTLTLTATVTAASGGTPSGTVTFFSGTTSLGTAALNSSAVATLTLTPAAGNYSITASYGGSSTDAPSQSAPPLLVTVNDIVTSTMLSVSATSLSAGQPLTLTANVTAVSGTAPTGTVTFNNGGILLGTANLNVSGVATLTLSPAVGSYSITASYGGSSTDAPSASSPAIAVTVNAIATMTALIASSNTPTFGQALTLTATVTPASGAVPTGTVTFNNGAVSLGTANLNGSGVATLTLSPAVGSYSITASYGGSPTDAASNSPPVAVNVSIAPTNTTLIASPNPAAFGANVTFTATVAATVMPSGSVSFYDGPTLLATITLASGAAAYSTSALSVGSHNITATYAGNSSFNSSTSNLIVEVISPADFNISASPASQSIYTGQATSYTVTITPGTGFTLPVALSCSVLPANTTCKFSPATVATGSGSSTLTIQTAAPSPSAAASVRHAKAGLTMLVGFLLLFIPRRLRRCRNCESIFPVLLASTVLLAAMAGCGGPGSLTGGTPVGAQTVTVTGIATNGAQTLTHATTVTLNVQSLF